MVPGFVAGLYDETELTLDVKALCEWAGWTFVEKSMTHLDHKTQTITCKAKTDTKATVLEYTVCALDIGSRTKGSDLPGVDQYAFCPRPLSRLGAKLARCDTEIAQLLETAEETKTSGPAVLKIVVIGTGAAGMELAIATTARWEAKYPALDVKVTLLEKSEQFFRYCNSSGLQKLMLDHVTQNAKFNIQYHTVATGITAQHVNLLTKGEPAVLDYDIVIWAGGARAHDFIQTQTNLMCDDRGYIMVANTLESRCCHNVFAAGDCRYLSQPGCDRNFPPKAGVHAVREGPVLIRNILKRLKGFPVTPYYAQRNILQLLCMADGTAMGGKWDIGFQGKWVWHLKDWIDKVFMAMYDAPQIIHGKKPLLYQPTPEPGFAASEVTPAQAAAALLVGTPGNDAPDTGNFDIQWMAIKRMATDETFRKDVQQLMKK
jgi:NADH dehydrogenase FAD-containing subunit